MFASTRCSWVLQGSFHTQIINRDPFLPKVFMVNGQHGINSVICEVLVMAACRREGIHLRFDQGQLQP